jgi:hypothetical protein
MDRVGVERLLGELCADLGYCLSPKDRARIIGSPPNDVDSFTDAVLLAEGRDPSIVQKKERNMVRVVVMNHFQRSSAEGPGN